MSRISRHSFRRSKSSICPSIRLRKFLSIRAGSSSLSAFPRGSNTRSKTLRSSPCTLVPCHGPFRWASIFLHLVLFQFRFRRPEKSTSMIFSARMPIMATVTAAARDAASQKLIKAPSCLLSQRCLPCCFFFFLPLVGSSFGRTMSQIMAAVITSPTGMAAQ